jgi:hypothetical protein
MQGDIPTAARPPGARMRAGFEAPWDPKSKQPNDCTGAALPLPLPVPLPVCMSVSLSVSLTLCLCLSIASSLSLSLSRSSQLARKPRAGGCTPTATFRGQGAALSPSPNARAGPDSEQCVFLGPNAKWFDFNCEPYDPGLRRQGGQGGF